MAVTSSNPAAGLLITAASPGGSGSVTVTIPVGASVSGNSVANGGVVFDPLAAGTTSISATILEFVSLPSATI
ncbi:MAG: hypothetical protein GWP44_09905 [Proteobacteria bacterium]|nr:hypothetical protein [Pseudomonadota bacterium]